MSYMATMNIPGYLPCDDEPPPVFDKPVAAWALPADERRKAEDDTEESAYSETVDMLDAYAAADHGADTVYGDTPGYESTHDLGIAYCVLDITPPEENCDETAHQAAR